jgi:hypothetical protein
MDTIEMMRLKDPQIPPTRDLLAEAMGDSYPIFDELIKTVTNEAFGLTTEWRYYNDGKAWLMKVCFKKKTVFWLSVWENYFKTSFYFTEKNSNGIYEMEIDETIKKDFNAQKTIGKLLPLTIFMKQKGQLSDLLKIVEYKKGLK